MKPGMTFSGSGMAGFEGLASTDFNLISITIDSSAVDAGNDTSTDLRKYLALARDTTTGKYQHYDGSLDDTSIVVLAEQVQSISDGDVVVKAFYRAIFKPGYIIEPSVVTWANVQRISIRKEK